MNILNSLGQKRLWTGHLLRRLAQNTAFVFLLVCLFSTYSCAKTVIGSYGTPNVGGYFGLGKVVLSPSRNKAYLAVPKKQPAQKTSAKVLATDRKSGSRQAGKNSSNTRVMRGKSGSVSGSGVCSTVRSQIGVRYKYGGTSPKTGFDCSGLVVWAYKNNGVNLPRTARAQASAGRQVKQGAWAPGDIVVFKLNRGYHTGVYVGNNKFIHSPSTGSNVREDSLANSYWKKAYIGARRVI